MSVMRIESNFNPAADNQVGYVGLIQFGKPAAESVGTTQEALVKMTFIEQMDYVKKYLEKKKDKLITRTDLYLLVMKPNVVGNGTNRDYAIFDESVEDDTTNSKRSLWHDLWVKKYAYIGNPTFMREPGEYDNWADHPTYSGKTKRARGFIGGKTYVWEVDEVIEYWYQEGLKPINFFSGKCDNLGEELTNTEGWHEPVDNPQITLYMQSGGEWAKYAAFGYTRKQTRKPHGQHQGLDIFALDDGNTNVYACLSGKITMAETRGTYGKMIVLEISDPEQLKIFKNRKREYSLNYKDDGEELMGEGFVDTGTIYMRYAHLQEMLVKKGDIVVAGNIIAKSGTSGIPNGGTCGPHVHFELASSLSGNLIANRINPGYYVYYKTKKDMTQDEIEI